MDSLVCKWMPWYINGFPGHVSFNNISISMGYLVIYSTSSVDQWMPWCCIQYQQCNNRFPCDFFNMISILISLVQCFLFPWYKYNNKGCQFVSWLASIFVKEQFVKKVIFSQRCTKWHFLYQATLLPNDQ
mgnify:CR=1 FL=1